MRLVTKGDKVIHLALSKANILTLLHKVDNPDSQKTISRYVEQDVEVVVTAEPDDEHYGDRPRGTMSPDTEEFLDKQQKGEEK